MRKAQPRIFLFSFQHVFANKSLFFGCWCFWCTTTEVIKPTKDESWQLLQSVSSFQRLILPQKIFGETYILESKKMTQNGNSFLKTKKRIRLESHHWFMSSNLDLQKYKYKPTINQTMFYRVRTINPDRLERCIGTNCDNKIRQNFFSL